MSGDSGRVSLFDLYALVPAAEETDLAYEAQAVREQRELDATAYEVWERTASRCEQPDGPPGQVPAMPPESEEGLPTERWLPGQVQGLLEHMLGAEVVDDDHGSDV